MKKIIILLISLILFFVLISCLNNNNKHENDIKLKVYSRNSLQTFYLEEEGNFIVLPDSVTNLTNYYSVFAEREGFYTNLYHCNYGDTLFIDLDAVVADKFCGVAFVVFGYDNIYYTFPNILINVYEDTIKNNSFTTDNNGRFAIDIENGQYTFSINPDSSHPIYEDLQIDVASDYKDLYAYYNVFVRKPNIYIYPKESTILDVSLEFPQGGKIVKSIPEYGDGWKNLTVEPNGMINDQYEFLFYESKQQDYCQYYDGWVIKRENLSTFFNDNMKATGFNEKEINDFIEYWIPRLTEFSYYAIYPQYSKTIEKMIKLNISQKPDNTLRLFYAINGLNYDNPKLTKPTIPQFNRDGFVVTEWGVILK